jgi:hypothetical protein
VEPETFQFLIRMRLGRAGIPMGGRLEALIVSGLRSIGVT